MGDESFLRPLAAAAAAKAAATMPFDINDAHSPMKVPVPSEGTGRGKKGGGRGGGGGRTPHRKAPAPQPPPPPSFQQAEWPDVASSPFQQAIPPAYGMTSGMAYPPAPAAGMPAPYPMACPPMPMYGMMPFMPYPHPMQYMPGMPNPVPAQPPEKSRGKQGTQGKASQRGGEGVNKKRRGKAKSKDGKGENPSDLEANPNCSEELLAVRSAQGNGVKAKLSFQEALAESKGSKGEITMRETGNRMGWGSFNKAAFQDASFKRPKHIQKAKAHYFLTSLSLLYTI